MIMIYLIMAILIIFILFLFYQFDKHKIYDKKCERCGNLTKLIPYTSNSNDTTRDYCRLFGNFIYDNPIHLCFSCSLAQDSYLTYLILLSIGHKQQIKEVEKIWGNNAIDMLALLYVARDNMDLARRILKEEEFEKIKPWIEDTISRDNK